MKPCMLSIGSYHITREPILYKNKGGLVDGGVARCIEGKK